MNLEINKSYSPQTWTTTILREAKERSGGIVEQQLVGAILARRFQSFSYPTYSVHTANSQSERVGDFTIAKLVYHVTADPSRNVLQKCAANLSADLHPILIIPRGQKTKARILAQDEGLDSEIDIVSIEDFVALNIIELATEESKDFFSVLQEIVQIYNRRLAEVETDLSLQIDVR